MKVKTREVYGAVIVDIEGHLVGGANSDTFREFIEGILEQQKTRIIVNLHKVPWANSQGVGMLIGSKKRHFELQRPGQPASKKLWVIEVEK